MKTKALLALISVLSLVLLSAPAFAESDSDVCGLGWQVTNKKSFAATTTRSVTNTFVPPTFGMTSGTMGCAQHTIVKKEEPAFRFLLANHHALELEMARGEGEYLAAFASEWGCAPSSFARFSEVLQKGFGEVYSEPSSNGVQVFERIRSVIGSDRELKNACVAAQS